MENRASVERDENARAQDGTPQALLDDSLSSGRVESDLSLTVPRYTNGRACDLNGLQEIIHVSRLSFFTHSCTRSFFVSSLKERNYTYSMYLSTVKVGSKSLFYPLKKLSLSGILFCMTQKDCSLWQGM